MIDALPAPLAPPEVDLRDFPFMPLEVNRLFRSRAWLRAKRRPALGFYMVNLWAVSWHEVPAGSLPDDDDALADYARCSPTQWEKVRLTVLQGWTRCSDGRLYHAVVVEKALEAWDRKLAQRQRTQAAREAKRRPRENSQETGTSISVTGNVTGPVTEPVTHTVTGSKGQGQGQGQRESLSEGATPTAPPDIASIIFGQGREWLMRQSGKPDRECRALLGKWRRDYGGGALIEALGAAQREGAIDVVQFITKALQARQESARRGSIGTSRRAGDIQAARIAALLSLDAETPDELEVVGEASLAANQLPDENKP